jgi:hypothetical protein
MQGRRQDGRHEQEQEQEQEADGSQRVMGQE